MEMERRGEVARYGADALAGENQVLFFSHCEQNQWRQETKKIACDAARGAENAQRQSRGPRPRPWAGERAETRDCDKECYLESTST